MKSIFRPLVLTAMAFALAAPLAAQEEPASSPAPAATETPAPPAADAPAAQAPAAAPAMTPEQYMGNPEYMLDIDLSTGGRVVIQLYPNAAPNHVERVKQLARQGFYDGVKFHRVIDGFMAQTGDPTATGQGGSSLPDLKAEFNDVPHMRGTVSMARAESPDSANSQFFIMLQPRFSLDHRYTAFGRVVSGMQYVDAIQKGEPPAVMSRMVQVSVAADNKPMPPASALVEAQPAPAEVTVDQLNAPLRQ
ncbi:MULTISPECIES: peptidylprolyl isomerase [unclassified Sphingopyxis]|jgi:peptidylprolyl isomerase|uniref:peptidylprolyl isomerase n=1 Tax=unclassified Sphingopyxis TaxID=2614943 RepID=UPI0007300081|nr:MULTISPECIES: peptidylprolyl isomerase [unclassified Sphingopyxis]KTE28180.1 peptidylprolyl isomerase [Sphingopyxis sp. H057]KTE55439.1 peptidylprolyl isomerase [Sphingopyxis sp. H073]KTE57673.1 peptidylprolyl isomerase [Sphingopyxis sp. H071]KTE61093.1 peptidylprolyl isomerase [Sphingopyxis sp. H107]KTE66326.1 peptidylprolyl isomerase [Sphingopyxis sp. H100]